MTGRAAAADWTGQRERGSALLVRCMTWLTLTLGWRVGQLLLYPITGYFLAFSPRARRASRAFLARALGRPARLAEVMRHFFSFSSVILDRLFLLTNRTEDYRIDIVGLPDMQAAMAGGRGCLLLGSHLGSFEVLRAMARHTPVRARALMYRVNDGALARLLERLNPQLAADVIDIGPAGTTRAMLEVHESLARGEIVGILADRTPASRKYLPAEFFGAPANFPTGPFILAAVAAAPVFLFFAVRTGPRQYRVHLQPFADPVALNRATRQDDLRRWIQLYVTQLAARCREYPYNWFNFFDFWDTSPDGHAANSAGDAAAGPARGASGLAD